MKKRTPSILASSCERKDDDDDDISIPQTSSTENHLLQELLKFGLMFVGVLVLLACGMIQPADFTELHQFFHGAILVCGM